MKKQALIERIRSNFVPGLARLSLSMIAVCLLLFKTPPQEFTLALLGDVMIGRGVYEVHVSQGFTQAPFRALSPWLAQADLTAANLESPLTDNPQPSAESTYWLCADVDALQILHNSRIDILSLANNHQDDCLLNGLEDTARFIRNAGFLPLYTEQPLTTTLNGFRITWLAWDLITNPPEESEMLALVNTAAAKSDLVIVSLHWGKEYSRVPTPDQRLLASHLADAGMDILWGHHAHVLQPIEWIDNTRGTRSLVIYNLGNALFDQYSPESVRASQLVLVHFGSYGPLLETVDFQINLFTGSVQLPND